jgi:hypothetical protein
LVRLVWSLRKKAGTGPEVPAKTYLYLIENRPKNGLYFQDSKMISYNKVADDIGEVTRLFTYSEKLCGIHFEDVLK